MRPGEAIDGGGGLVTAGPFKILIDGSLNTRTACCFDPYPDGSRGTSTVQPKELVRLMRRAADAGLTPAVHAIGDRANRIVLDAFETVGVAARIEHAQLVRAEDLSRFADLGIVASVQPRHAMTDRDVADHHWHGRTENAFLLQSFLDHGAELAFGSDAPVTPLDPWPAMAAATTRTEGDLSPWPVEQAVSRSAALRASSRGQVLRVGHRADVVGVEQDPLCCSDDELRAMPVALTVLSGTPTYSAID